MHPNNLNKLPTKKNLNNSLESPAQDNLTVRLTIVCNLTSLPVYSSCSCTCTVLVNSLVGSSYTRSHPGTSTRTILVLVLSTE